MTSNRTILYLGTYERDYPRNRQIIRLLRRSGCRVVEIHRPFWELYRDKSRGLNGLSGAGSAAIRLSLAYASILTRCIPRLRQVDAVVIGYIGQLDMLALAPLFRFLGIPVIFNPLVTLTDTVVEDRQLVRERSLAARAVAMIDSLALKLSSAVIVDTPETGEYLTNRFGLKPERIWMVDVGADESRFPGGGGAAAGSGSLHVLFYGKMIPLHGIETILAAIEHLQQRGEPDLCFEIIGSGQLEHLVHEFRARHPEAPIVHRPWVAYSRLAQRIHVADCVLGVFGTGEKAARVIPNKVYQAMAMGVPIVTRQSQAVSRVLEDRESALLVPPGDPVALADAIRELRDPNLRGRLGRNARAAFEQWGSDTALGSRVSDLLGGVVPLNVRANAPERRS